MTETNTANFIRDRKLGFGLKTLEREDGVCLAYLPSGAIALCKDYESVPHDEVPAEILPVLLTLHEDREGNPG